MADTANYTHFDIDRYLNNKMTRQEMHDFEKAMLEDPFLTDAFEGYSKSDRAVVEVHLAGIERQLTIKEEKAKVVAMPAAKRTWWKVAAVILLVAGGSAISYRLFNKSAAPAEMAVNKSFPAAPADTIRATEKAPDVPQIFPVPENKAIAKTKSTSPVIGESFGNNNAAPRGVAANYDSALTASASTTLAYQQAAVKAEEMNVAGSAKMMSSTEKATDALAGRVPGLEVQREFKGRVRDVRGEPLPFATIRGNKDIGAVADANGNFRLKAPDSVLDVAVVVLGYGTTRATLKSNTANNEVLVNEKAGSDLAEVVVTALGKKRRDTNSVIDQNRVANKGSGTQPVKGWRQFQQYIFENIQHIKDTSEVYESGDVVLEFFVDEEGRPSKIKATESLNRQNAEKAIELLQNGPRWTRKKSSSKGKVVVIF